MPKRILIVDDSPSMRQQVAKALQEGGFEATQAGDGESALSALAMDQGIAALICDLHMPGMGGMELLERLAAEGRTANLPIVMLTSDAQPALMARAKAAGARGWIVKPFKPAALLAAVQQVTR